MAKIGRRYWWEFWGKGIDGGEQEGSFVSALRDEDSCLDSNPRAALCFALGYSHPLPAGGGVAIELRRECRFAGGVHLYACEAIKGRDWLRLQGE